MPEMRIIINVNVRGAGPTLITTNLQSHAQVAIKSTWKSLTRAKDQVSLSPFRSKMKQWPRDKMLKAMTTTFLKNTAQPKWSKQAISWQTRPKDPSSPTIVQPTWMRHIKAEQVWTKETHIMTPTTLTPWACQRAWVAWALGLLEASSRVLASQPKEESS